MNHRFTKILFLLFLGLNFHTTAQSVVEVLFIIPDDPTRTFPLLCYQHGTVSDRNDVPSLLAGGSELAIIFGSMGYVTTAADFLGLGTARGVHPYVHADSEASASIDMMYAMRTYADTDPAITLNNDVFDWAPTAPTRLFYCMADDQVTFRNSILADSVMNANDAIDLDVIDVDSDQDHGGCVDPATTATIAFFAQFQETTVGIEEVFTQDLFEVYPNPVNDLLTIQIKNQRADIFTVQLFDVYGKLVKTEVTSGNTLSLEVGGLPVGLYWLSINDGTVRGVEKINIQR